MEDKTKATELSMEENKTIGRRELLKALAAGGGAVAASAVVSGKWVKPVVEAGVLPAHAATSVFTYFGLRSDLTVTANEVDDLGEVQPGPSAILVVVEGNIAHVEANNSHGDVRLVGDLDTNGTPSTMVHQNDCHGGGEGSQWSVVDHDPGNTITIFNGGGESWSQVVVPEGDDDLPDIECD